MRAAFYEIYGGPEVIQVGEQPDVPPRSGEVRVKVRASGVNPSDCKRRSGTRDRPGYPVIIPHNDGAGVIQDVGEGVDPAVVGRRVWIWNGQRRRALGTAAECITIDLANTVAMADGISFQEGACLGVPAMTAYQSLFGEGDIAGMRVLVTGGAGAVGHYAVQFAKLAGARQVIATVSSPSKAEHARRAGADAVIDYRSEDVVARVRDLTDGAGVDRVSEVDFGVNHAVTIEVLANNGVVGAYGSAGDYLPSIPTLPWIYKDAVVRFQQCNLMKADLRARGAHDVTRWCREGRLIHAIGRVYPLAETAAAHAAVESGEVIGNVVVEI